MVELSYLKSQNNYRVFLISYSDLLLEVLCRNVQEFENIRLVLEQLGHLSLRQHGGLNFLNFKNHHCVKFKVNTRGPRNPVEIAPATLL